MKIDWVYVINEFSALYVLAVAVGLLIRVSRAELRRMGTELREAMERARQERRMRVFVTWIDRRNYPPTREDASAAGCVLVWHSLNGCMVMNWHEANTNRYVTHWMKMPGRPA